MTPRVLMLNHSQEACGVQQYGKRMSQKLSQSSSIEFSYCEINGPEQLWDAITRTTPDVIIYNYHAGTLPWLSTDITNTISSKQVYIHHENDLPVHLRHDAFLIATETHYDGKDNKIFALPRPVPDVQNTVSRADSSIIRVGSFGLAFPHKGFDVLCKRVQEEYDDAIINLHLTRSHFVDPSGSILESVVASCHSTITKPGIQLNIDTQFTTDQDLVDFLCRNDINVFMYQQSTSNGIASSTDYIPKTTSPFAVNSSIMFRHITSKYPEVNCDKNSLDSILRLGTTINEKLSEEWSTETIYNTMDRLLETL